MEGMTMPASITHTFVNGHVVYENGLVIEDYKGMRMAFDRK
jgi:dihydroorotase